MQFDQYGRPIHRNSGHEYGYAAGAQAQPSGATPNNLSARTVMPNVGAMGGSGVPWVRFPFFPTAPFYSTNPNVGTQVRYYSASVLSTDADMTLGTESIRTVTFDIPVRVIAINGNFGADTNNALPAGMDSRDTFLFRAEYTTGDRLHVNSALGSTVVGTGDNPGEIGSTGYTVDQGGSLVLGVTPRAIIGAAGVTTWRIDIVLHCLEIRGSSNFVGGPAGR